MWKSRVRSHPYLQKLYNHDVDKKDRLTILTKTQMYKEELKRENGLN